MRWNSALVIQSSRCLAQWKIETDDLGHGAAVAMAWTRSPESTA